MSVQYLYFPKCRKKLDEEKCKGFRKTGKPGLPGLQIATRLIAHQCEPFWPVGKAERASVYQTHPLPGCLCVLTGFATLRTRSKLDHTSHHTTWFGVQRSNCQPSVVLRITKSMTLLSALSVPRSSHTGAVQHTPNALNS